MPLSISELRRAWAPACAPKGDVFLDAYLALDECLRTHNYRPRKADTGAYNCRKITGGDGYSAHAYGPGNRFTFWSGARVTMAAAVDINWQTNPYGPRLVTDMPPEMVDAIEAIRTVGGYRVWQWGGRFAGNKDAMHFEIDCAPAALARGIDPATVPNAAPAPVPPPEPEDDDMPTPDELSLLMEAAATKAIDKALSDPESDLNKRLRGISDKVDRSTERLAKLIGTGKG